MTLLPAGLSRPTGANSYTSYVSLRPSLPSRRTKISCYRVLFGYKAYSGMKDFSQVTLLISTQDTDLLPRIQQVLFLCQNSYLIREAVSFVLTNGRWCGDRL